MSQIYIHYTDKTLVLDSSENLLYPLLGSLLRWDNLRVAFAISLTQSLSDNNAGFADTETLPIASNMPILNHVSIGLKNRGLELPGEAGCTFLGYTNQNGSNGSSLGKFTEVITLSTKDVITFNMTLQNPGVSGYAITSTPKTVNLTAPFNDQGTFYQLPAGQEVKFNGKSVELASPLGNGQSTVSLVASPSTTLFNADVAGTAKSLQIDAGASLGTVVGTSYNTSTSVIPSQCISFPASFVMQGNSNYATILVMDFKVQNRGTPSQSVKCGYQVVPNVGNTSITNLEALMASYSPTFEMPSYVGMSSAMPTCVFVRWPFPKTRLRIHAITAKKF
jgi:hypothetical protein